jgi:methionyl-tRNA formyltransferase
MTTMRVVFMGTPEFALPTLALLADRYQLVGVYTRRDKPAGRGQEVALSPVKEYALARGLPLYQPGTLRKAEPVAELRALEPDLIVVAAFGLILPQEVLDIPRHGCLNVHASLLPRWRGAAPVAAAILAGDAETGCTMMRMDAGVDTGPILAQKAMPIASGDTTGNLTLKLAQLGAELLAVTLPRWLGREIAPQPQDETHATYAPMARKEDGKLEWARPADFLARQVRACQPWPGAYTTWKGQLLKVWRAHALHVESAGSGSVVAWEGGAAVGAGEGLLALDEVQLAGRRPAAMAEFLRGARGFIGSVLGT